MPRKIFLPLGLAVIAVWSAYAAVVTGTVADTEGETLPGATVTLKTLPDSTRVDGTITDFDGFFTLSDVAPGNYSLVFSMVGLKDLPVSFEVKTPGDTITFNNIRLADDRTMLEEVVVQAVRPAIVARQDTLEYNADSYHTSPNATVEDLLKRLPGVEVGADGSLTTGGKTVTKVLVNGKEFFNDDPQAATKNLTADMVEKVQVIDKKSDLALLTGVDDGEEETVINLTVKKDMQNGWFGTAKGGYGTSGRYEASVNANYFSNGNQISIIGGANNINELGFGDRGRGRFRDFGGNGGITTSQRIGVNFNVGKDEIFRVGGNVFYTHSSRDSRQRSATQFLFPDSVSYQNSGNRTLDRGHNFRADFRMQWNIDENNTLDFRPRFSLNYRNSEMNDSSSLFYEDFRNGGYTDVNSIRNLQSNHGLSWQTDGDLIFNHKVASHPGRSMSAQFKYTFTSTRQHGTTWSDIEYYLLNEDSESLFRYLDNHQWSNSVEGRLTWTEPLRLEGGHFLNVSYRIAGQFNNADKLTYNVPFDLYVPGAFPDFGSVPEGSQQAVDLSNRFRNTFFSQELQIGYKKVGKRLNLEAGVLFAPSSSKSEDLINPLRNIPKRWVWNVGPFARIKYKFGERGSLDVNYRARTSQPSLTQLQPVADVSDPLNIIVGNPDLKPTFTQSVNARVNNFNTERQQTIAAMLSASYALNTIVSRTTTDPTSGVRTTTYANANGNLNLMGMMMFNQPFGRTSAWRINARLTGRYNNVPGYINGDYNRSGNLVLTPSVGVTFSSGIFQATLNPTYSFNMATNSLPMQDNRYVHSYGFTGDASLYFPFGLEVSTDIDYSYSTGYTRGFQSRQALWNAQASYSVLKDRSLTFSVRVYDILGQRQNISRTVSANQISDSEHNDLTRYIMFGVAWRFSSFKKNAVTNAEGEFPDGIPPQGPPPGFDGPQGPPPGMGTRSGGMPGPPPGGFGGPSF